MIIPLHQATRVVRDIELGRSEYVPIANRELFENFPWLWTKTTNETTLDQVMYHGKILRKMDVIRAGVAILKKLKYRNDYVIDWCGLAENILHNGSEIRWYYHLSEIGTRDVCPKCHLSSFIEIHPIRRVMKEKNFKDGNFQSSRFIEWATKHDPSDIRKVDGYFHSRMKTGHFHWHHYKDNIYIPFERKGVEVILSNLYFSVASCIVTLLEKVLISKTPYERIWNIFDMPMPILKWYPQAPMFIKKLFYVWYHTIILQQNWKMSVQQLLRLCEAPGCFAELDFPLIIPLKLSSDLIQNARGFEYYIDQNEFILIEELIAL